MNNNCEHKFVYLDTKKSNEYNGFVFHYIRIDTFYCEKCLEYKDKKQETHSRERPDWW